MSDLPTPGRLGSLSLVSKLGAGGMGTVYLAELTEDRDYGPSGTRVAVKVLNTEREESGKGVLRYLQEARVGGRVRHPSVVRTYDADVLEQDGEKYYILVMEYVEGRTLDDLMAELCPVPEALLRDLGMQMARGLEAIHGAGVVHRDIKPTNVLITPDHQVKLMDMGVARILDETQWLTATGFFVGSVRYAAPEQFGSEEIGPPADLYALGLVLYQAATGSYPFDTKEFSALMRMQLEQVPEKVGRLNPQQTPFLEEVISCLLEKAPERRFESAGKLAEVLEQGESSPWWQERERALRAGNPRHELRRIALPREAPLVGRRTELEWLRKHYDEAKAGRGRFLLLEGETGVGKSRLLDEFVARLEASGEDVQVLYGSYRQGGVGGNRALAEAVVEHLGVAGLEEELARYLSITPRLVPGFAAHLTGQPVPQDAERLLLEAVDTVYCHLARGLARERPVVWIAEDLHHSAAEGRAVLLSLARIVHGERLLLVATSRPGMAPEELAQFERLEATDRLKLERLSENGVRELLQEAFGSDRLTDELGATVTRRSDGNLLFALALLRELREGGFVKRRDNGSWAIVREASSVEMPAAVRELLLTRLRGLTDSERRLLDAGAVQGFRFDPDLVARVTGEKRLAVLQGLAELERRNGVVRAAGRAFQFDHHQLQELLYGELPPSLREEYHHLLAEAYEEREGLADVPIEKIPGEAAVFVAEHSLLGRRTERAKNVLLRALDHLEEHYRHEALLMLARFGHEAIGDGDPRLSCELYLRQATCQQLLGRRGDEGRSIEKAIEAARTSGDNRALAEAIHLKMEHLVAVGELASAKQHGEEGLALAEETGDTTTKLQVLRTLGDVLHKLGESQRAEKLLEILSDEARAHGDRMLEARAANALACVQGDSGKYRAAYAALSQAAVLAHEAGDSRTEAVASTNLGQVCRGLGHYEEAVVFFERALTLGRRIGSRFVETKASLDLGNCHWTTGDLGAATTQLTRVIELCTDTESQMWEAEARTGLSYIAYLEGRPAEAENECRQALEFFRSSGYSLGELRARFGLGELAWASRDFARARAEYEHCLARAEETGAEQELADSLFALGRLAVEEKDFDKARPLLERAERVVESHGLAEPGRLPTAYLALLGDREPQDVVMTDLGATDQRAEAHLALHRAGAGGDHLEQAQLLLERMSSHLEAEALAGFWNDSPFGRMFLEAGGTPADRSGERTESD